MSNTSGATRQLAYVLVSHAARRLSGCRDAWADPMRCEVEAIESDVVALRWAVGCVVASYSERIKSMNLAFIFPLFGVVAMMAFVFGGYVMAGGNLGAIFVAVPTEMMVIVMGALATSTIRTTVGGPGISAALKRSLLGRQYRKADYRDLASVLFNTLNTANPIALPTLGDSALHGDAAARMISDAAMLMEKKQLAPDRIDVILQSRIHAILDGQRRAVHVLRTLGRSLLWFGVLAFLLGAIKTLFSITEFPEVIGGMLGHSAVGPVIGIFFAAGIVVPLANRLDAAITDDANFFELIRTAFFCRLAGGDALLAVRTACGALPPELALDPAELEALSASTSH